MRNTRASLLDHPARRRLLAHGLLIAVLAVSVAGCSNPDAPNAASRTHAARRSRVQSPGETPAAPPSAPASQAPEDVQRTPVAALEAFARLYSNWTYRTLATDQRRLAAISVGAARLAERQAAASSASDGTITRGRIWNRGQIISITADRARAGMWVLVTREQTGGDSEYEGLPASFHVTLARLARLPGGFAVSEWSPQG